MLINIPQPTGHELRLFGRKKSFQSINRNAQRAIMVLTIIQSSVQIVHTVCTANTYTIMPTVYRDLYSSITIPTSAFLYHYTGTYSITIPAPIFLYHYTDTYIPLSLYRHLYSSITIPAPIFLYHYIGTCIPL